MADQPQEDESQDNAGTGAEISTENDAPALFYDVPVEDESCPRITSRAFQFLGGVLVRVKVGPLPLVWVVSAASKAAASIFVPSTAVPLRFTAVGSKF